MAHECSYCGDSFKNQQGRAAHERFCDDNPDNQEDSGEDNTKDSSKITETIKEPDSEFYALKGGKLEIEDLDEPESVCPECGSSVKPGINCQSCGEELNWYAGA